MMYFVLFILGVIAGALVVSVYQDIKTAVGSLKIDATNAQSPIVLNIPKDLDTLAKKKYISIKLDVNKGDSQK